MTVSQRLAVPTGSLSWSARPIRSDAPAQQTVGAEFSAQQIEADLTWVGVRGEIDIRNATALQAFSRRCLEATPRMVLDLAAVEFFGAVGLSVFEDLDECAQCTGARWALVSGRPVQRLLRVAAPSVSSRTHTTLESAVAALNSAA